MITFPNAKINIGLNVVSKRGDGYHNLETIFYPVKLCDALEMVEAGKTGLSVSGIAIDGVSDDNLILKACRLLQHDFDLPPVQFHLHKAIPFGAGLGGGSADAAFALKMLNEHFSLALSTHQLEKYASRIGADCPFFIQNRAVFATGIGNKFQPVELDLSSYHIVILKPGTSVATRQAYSQVVPTPPQKQLTEIIKSPIETWKDQMVNDFEISVFAKHPEIPDLKKLLYKSGALFASMSGSGSAVFGIFRHLPTDFANRIPVGIYIYR